MLSWVPIFPLKVELTSLAILDDKEAFFRMVHSNIVFRSLLMLALLCTAIVLTNGTSNQIQLVRAQAISTTINEYPVLRGTYPWGTAMSKKRSEERRVGKECRSRWSRYHE